MPFRLFGWEFDFDHKSSNAAIQTTRPAGTALSPVPPENTDGALNIQYGAGGGYYGYYLDLDGAVVDDFQLINRYREMQFVAEVDEAIDQIITELVIQDAGRMPVSLDLGYVDSLEDDTKIRIQAEFDGLLKQMNFHKDAYTIMRQWYIDGRMFYYLVVDEAHPENGIIEMRVIDPRTIKKVREVTRKRHEATQMDIVEVQREYFVYNPMGFVSPAQQNAGGGTASLLQYNGAKLTLDSVGYVPSGLYDTNKKTVLSWLHKAIKPLNLLRMMEDSCVIYRISRAPERRVFYIDVGNLPKGKAEDYLNAIMTKYKNKLVYDVSTGEVRDDRKFMSIMEDFWLPRREGGKGTEIQTLPAGQNLSEMEDVDYFRRKLYRALFLPPSRIDQGTGFSLGRSSEISRDELRFQKFIHRLQIQFNNLFDQLLEKQLRLKNILTEVEWFRIKDAIRYKWQTDSYFEELKNQEIWTSRLTLIQLIEPYLNKFFSNGWVNREILKLTEDEIATMKEEFDETAGGNPFDTGGSEEGEQFGIDGEDEGSGGTSDFDQQADDILADTDTKLGDEDEDGDLNLDDDETNFHPGDDKTDDDEEDGDEVKTDDIDADIDGDGDEDEDDVKIAVDKVIGKDKADDEDEEDEADKKSGKGNLHKPPFGKKA